MSNKNYTYSYVQTERYNLNPSFWGPHAWFFLENIAFSYPKKPTKYHKELFKNFFSSVGKIIPCQACRLHFKQNLNINPLTDKILQHRDSFIEWVFNFHNQVRKSQNKKPFTHSQIMKYYDNYRPKSTGNTDNTKEILVFVIFILVLCIGYLFYKQNNLKKK